MQIDSPDGVEGAGYLWDGALRAGLSIRNYGVFADELASARPPYSALAPYGYDPYVAFQNGVPAPVVASHPSLNAYTDPFFMSYDQGFPDLYRYREWAREFDGYVAKGNLPNFEIVRLSHDHMGHFYVADLGVNTPETQSADNDYSVALLVEKISKSRYAGSTLIFVLEDDAQDGGDHVDAHRSTAYVVGPYVKQGAVVSTHYATVNMIRTMEDILGLEHQNLHDAGVPPMVDVFDLEQSTWSFKAVPSAYLLGTQLSLSQFASADVLTSVLARGPLPKPTHDAAWWGEKTSGMDFRHADSVDPVAFNRILWQGLKGNVPYPVTRSGADLRSNRAELLRLSSDGGRPE
jgi:hypothetical protein